MRRILGIVVGLGLLVAVPASARAQDSMYLTPFIGVSDGSDFTVGATGSLLMEPMTIDIDFGWATADDDFFDVDGNYLTLMGGTSYLFETGTIVEPYAAGGLGLIRVSFDSPVFGSDSSSAFGLNVGGGAHFFFSETMGARADLRYFRALSGDLSDADLGFWRFTGGITFKL